MNLPAPPDTYHRRIAINAGYAATVINRINGIGVTYKSDPDTIEAILCNNDDDAGHCIKLSLNGWHHLIDAVYRVHPNTTVTYREIRYAAKILERMSSDYPIASPTDMKWSANTLRHEANLCYRDDNSAVTA